MAGLLDREDVIHFSVRKFLKSEGWTLVAGEYPNGSDDELHSLRIMDPYFSKDESPDHRRHSLNKLVPDLVSYKNNEFLIIEMKPKYSKEDEEKLVELLGVRSADLILYLNEFICRYFPDIEINVSESNLTPALGFASNSEYSRRDGFAYLLVSGLDSVEMIRDGGGR